MEWIILSLTIAAATGAATGTVLYFVHRWQTPWLKERLLHEKQLEVYQEISQLVSQVKATLEYSTGDETLGEWRSSLMSPLREILYKSYEWAVFLPKGLQDRPSQYASKVARGLTRLQSLPPEELDAYAEIIDDIKKLESEAANELQSQIRQELGVNRYS